MKEYIAYFLIILGWIIVHYLSSRRDRKKEWRDFSRETAKYLDKITDLSIKYHTEENVRNVNLERELVDFIDDLDMRIVLLKENLKINASVSKFREAITLDNFETARFVKLDYNDKIVRKIIISSRELKSSLYKT